MSRLTSKLAGLFSDDLLKHSSILFSGMMVVHVCNMLFPMGVSRALPKEEYALLVAFLALLTMIQRPLGTLTTGIAHYSSLMRQDGRAGDVKRLLRKWLVLTGVPGVIFGALAVFFSHPLSQFFHLERTAPVVIGGVTLPVLFCAPVLMGAVQGLQLFKTGSVAGVIGAFVRTGVGVGLVWFYMPACGWAMVGHGVGAYATSALLLAGLLFLLRGRGKTTETLPSMRLYLVQSFLIQASCAVLMTAHVVLVKHFIPEDSDFAFAATLGNIVIFLPGPIVVAMFPKVASAGVGTQAQRTVFLRSLGMTALFVVAAVAGCVFLPGLLARILFGIKDAPAYLKQMIGLMALVMGAASLVNVTVQYLLAQRRFAPALSVIVSALVYLGGVWFFHETVWHIAGWALGCNGVAFGLMLLWLLNEKGGKDAER